MGHSLLYINKREDFLVYLLVFAAWWQFMFGLQHFDGGVNIIWKAVHGEIILYLLIIITSLFFINRNSKAFYFSITNQKAILFFTFCYIPILLPSFLVGGFGVIMLFLLIVIFLSLRDELKIRVLDVFIKVLSFTLFLSIIEYLLFVVVGKSIIVCSLNNGSRYYYQLLFNFVPVDSLIPLGPFTFFRFQSLSDEPGSVGTVCAFLLFATSNCKQFKYPYLIFWIAGILSFSAAFYILAAIHLAFSFNRHNFRYYIIGGILAFLLYQSFQDAFDWFVFRRFSVNDIQSLDNRSEPEFDAQLLAAYNDGSLWLGKGFKSKINISVDGGVAGAKAFLWIYGIIGTIAIWLGYTVLYFTSLMRQHKSVRRYGLIFFMVFLFSFYQRETITYFDYVVIFFTMPVFLSYKKICNIQFNIK